MSHPTWLSLTRSGIVVTVHVQPGSRRPGPAGLFDGVPRVRIGSAAREGAANDELVRWLARELGVPRACVTVKSGDHGRRKRIAIEGVPAELATRIAALWGF